MPLYPDNADPSHQVIPSPPVPGIQNTIAPQPVPPAQSPALPYNTPSSKDTTVPLQNCPSEPTQPQEVPPSPVSLWPSKHPNDIAKTPLLPPQNTMERPRRSSRVSKPHRELSPLMQGQQHGYTEP